MRLQPHYLCPKGVKTRRIKGRPRIRVGDVKVCYVRIKRRWIRVGTLCLHCRQFHAEI